MVCWSNLNQAILRMRNSFSYINNLTLTNEVIVSKFWKQLKNVNVNVYILKKGLRAIISRETLNLTVSGISTGIRESFEKGLCSSSDKNLSKSMSFEIK